MENQWVHPPEAEPFAARETLPDWVPPPAGFKPDNFDTPAMKGSVQQNLARNLGIYVAAEFLLGADRIRREGILYSVGTSYFTLYEEAAETLVMCDIASVRFVTFYRPGHRPGEAAPAGPPTARQSGSGGAAGQRRNAWRR